MRKLISKLMFITLSVTFFSSCSNSNESSNTILPTETNQITDTKEDDDYMNKTLVLKIDNQEVDVSWLENDSVNQLMKLAKDGLTLELHEYGGFEQTGLIRYTLPSNDSRIDVVPGDIVLYNSNQISIFYNNSSWSYTKLGHINLSDSELKELLSSEEHITITLTLK